MSPQIISIGLPKTGTRTLMSCLRTLGYTHSGDAFQQRRLLDWTASNYVVDPEDVQDEPAFAFWEGLAKACPDAKLIMTVREFEPWYKSCAWLKAPMRMGPKTERRIELDANVERSCVERTPALEWLLGLVGGGWSYDEEAHNVVWCDHFVRVLRAFEDSDRLLTWDLTQDSRWEPLCEFLDRPVPDKPFPWVNKTRAK